MLPIVGTAYDQNPARIASIVRKNRKRRQNNKNFSFVILAGLAAGLSFVLNAFFTKAG